MKLCFLISMLKGTDVEKAGNDPDIECGAGAAVESSEAPAAKSESNTLHTEPAPAEDQGTVHTILCSCSCKYTCQLVISTCKTSHIHHLVAAQQRQVLNGLFLYSLFSVIRINDKMHVYTNVLRVYLSLCTHPRLSAMLEIIIVNADLFTDANVCFGHANKPESITKSDKRMNVNS